MEVLSDILRSIRVEGSVYFCSQVAAPWRKEFRDTTCAGFHLIRRGACWAIVGDEVIRLSQGDLIFLRPGVDHLLTSESPDGNQADLGEDTLLLCGYCRYSDSAVTPLLEVFPTTTIVRDEELIKHPWLRGTFDQLSAEYLEQKPGSELIVNKLTEVVLVELIRINFGREQRHPFLEALSDKRISRSLQLIHEAPEYSWTLEQLAEQIGMSRAAFSKRFKALVGQPVFSYLTDLRMQKAKTLLQESMLPVYEVAARTGYESERAFTNTFKKHVGATPRRFRNEQGR